MDIEMVDLLRKMVDEAPFGMYVLDGERVPVLVHTEPLFSGDKSLGAIEYFRVLPVSEYPIPKER